jgi:hypothetical protein
MSIIFETPWITSRIVTVQHISWCDAFLMPK